MRKREEYKKRKVEGDVFTLLHKMCLAVLKALRKRKLRIIAF